MVMAKERRREKQISQEVFIWENAEAWYYRREFVDGTCMYMKRLKQSGELTRVDYLPIEAAAHDRIGGLSAEAERLLNQAVGLQYGYDGGIEEKSNKLFSLITEAVLLGSRVEAELKADRHYSAMSELHIASTKVSMAKDQLLQTARGMIGALMPVKTVDVKATSSDRVDHMTILKRIELVLDDSTKRYKPLAAPCSQYLLFKALAILSALKDQTREYVTALMAGGLNEQETRQTFVVLNKLLTFIAIVVQRFNGVSEDQDMYNSVNGFITGQMSEGVFLTNLNKDSKE